MEEEQLINMTILLVIFLCFFELVIFINMYKFLFYSLITFHMYSPVTPSLLCTLVCWQFETHTCGFIYESK